MLFTDNFILLGGCWLEVDRIHGNVRREFSFRVEIQHPDVWGPKCFIMIERQSQGRKSLAWTSITVENLVARCEDDFKILMSCRPNISFSRRCCALSLVKILVL
jgi:hypothetical protein